MYSLLVLKYRTIKKSCEEMKIFVQKIVLENAFKKCGYQKFKIQQKVLNKKDLE